MCPESGGPEPDGPEPDGLVPSSLRWSGDDLLVEGVRCAEIAESAGTPCFVFSRAQIEQNVAALKAGLEAAVDARLRYCAKTNHQRDLLALIAQTNCEVLVSHAGELKSALAAGFPPERIAYQRPWVPEEDLDAILDAGIGLLHAYRSADLDRFEQAARIRRRPVAVSLRLRQARRRSLSPLKAAAARSGFSGEEALTAARRCRDSDWIRIVGLNRYLGTQLASLRAFAGPLATLAELATGLQREAGCDLRELNLGGGLPSPTMRRNRPSTILRRIKDSWPASPTGGDPRRTFAAALAERFVRAVDGLSPAPRLVIEPGRAIVGDAGFLLTRVVARDGRWITCDGSRSALPESPLLFSRRILLDGKARESKRRHQHLAGSTLNTVDVIDYGRRLPPLEIGDLLVLCDAGAYSLSRASHYASQSPKVILVEGERLRPIEETGRASESRPSPRSLASAEAGAG